MEKAWVNAYKEKVGNLSALKRLKENYEEALKEVISLEIKDPKDSLSKKSEKIKGSICLLMNVDS